ncbi:hypothetical protein [Rubritalea tangerina]|uniref:Uncharacterized protein n=1 Tax=Rubritalea tangerina TaxID=430798 RepID=A0ABW4ZC40_9BACT
MKVSFCFSGLILGVVVMSQCVLAQGLQTAPMREQVHFPDARVFPEKIQIRTDKSKTPAQIEKLKNSIEKQSTWTLSREAPQSFEDVLLTNMTGTLVSEFNSNDIQLTGEAKKLLQEKLEKSNTRISKELNRSVEKKHFILPADEKSAAEASAKLAKVMDANTQRFAAECIKRAKSNGGNLTESMIEAICKKWAIYPFCP